MKNNFLANNQKRNNPLDMLRGIIMAIMAIDHASYFILKVHLSEFWGTPLPQYQHLFAFMTRWITHICAPGFFFLMGIGMVYYARPRQEAGWSQNKILRFFMTRGLILIALQFMVENPTWLLGKIGGHHYMTKPPGGGDEVMMHFGVLFGLGASMILTALLIRLKSFIIAGVSAGSILASQLLTPAATDAGTLFNPLLRLIFIPGQTDIWQVHYSIFPWFGITGLGIIFARLLIKRESQVYRFMPFTGISLLLGFIAIRMLKGFGNYSLFDTGLISFLNVTKYPASLSFITLTLGINLLLLYLLFKGEKHLVFIGRPMLNFGRVALFFYIAHLYLYSIIGLAFPKGTTYLRMYLVWFTGLLILLPLCNMYRKFKTRTPLESIWRLF
jgi:uncharacterized membrane protein